MFKFSFIVLLLLLCRVCYCDACKCLHGLGICVWFYPNKLMMNVIGILRGITGADPGGVQGVLIPALLIGVPFFDKNIFSKHVVS